MRVVYLFGFSFWKKENCLRTISIFAYFGYRYFVILTRNIPPSMFFTKSRWQFSFFNRREQANTEINKYLAYIIRVCIEYRTLNHSLSRYLQNNKQIISEVTMRLILWLEKNVGHLPHKSST